MAKIYIIGYESEVKQYIEEILLKTNDKNEYITVDKNNSEEIFKQIPKHNIEIRTLEPLIINPLICENNLYIKENNNYKRKKWQSPYKYHK